MNKGTRIWDRHVSQLDNLASAYHKCENLDIKQVWKQKWYEMCGKIASEIRQNKGKDGK